MSMDEYTVKDSFLLPRMDKLWHTSSDDKCMTHSNLRYTYNRIECMMTVYTMVPSLRQALQGLTPKTSSCLLYILKLREHQRTKDAYMFWGRAELSILMSLWTIILF